LSAKFATVTQNGAVQLVIEGWIGGNWAQQGVIEAGLSPASVRDAGRPEFHIPLNSSHQFRWYTTVADGLVTVYQRGIYDRRIAFTGYE
jgi:hypothetical protein